MLMVKKLNLHLYQESVVYNMQRMQFLFQPIKCKSSDRESNLLYFLFKNMNLLS